MSLNKFVIERNEYLERDIEGFYRTDYYSMSSNNSNHPLYLNILKNEKKKNKKIWTNEDLLKAFADLLCPEWEEDKDISTTYIENELMEILNIFPKDNIPILICIVPRAKPDSRYDDNQLWFRLAIQMSIQELIKSKKINRAIFDGTDYIVRHTPTKTTHRMRYYHEDGKAPYPNISKDTCNFSDEIQGKHILLIDDIYTEDVNVDEDFLQALIDMGCKELKFFAIAKTL